MAEEQHVHVDETVLIKFAQRLAENEKRTRDAAVKKLRKWMTYRSTGKFGAFREDDMMKLWKGLHYCMWMSDKPLVQEELADKLSNLIGCFEEDLPAAFMFIDTFFKTEAREWYNIDRLRLDKFMMLIRKFFNRSLVLLQSHDWEEEHIKHLVDILSGHVINSTIEDVPAGIKLHIADIYLDELEKVGIGQLTAEQVFMFLEPYCVFLSKEKSKSTAQHILKRIFFRLIDYAIDKEARREREEEKSDDEDVDDDEEKNDDRPTGLEVDYTKLADRILALAGTKECFAKNRKYMYNIVKTYRDLAQGIIPQEEEVSSGEEPLGEQDIQLAMNRMQKLDKSMQKESGRNMKRKKGQVGGSEDEDSEMSDSEIENDDEDRPPTKKQKTSKSGQKVTSKAQGKKLKKTQNSEEKGLNSNVKKKTKRNRPMKQNESLDRGKEDNAPMFKREFNDNSNNTPINNSTKKIKRAKRKKTEETEQHQDTDADTQKSGVRVESNNGGKDSSEDIPVQADIVVPSRKGKLKHVVQQSLMDKPTLKVVENEAEIIPSNGGELDLAQKVSKILNSGGSDDTMELFSGGFVDSDDDAEKAAKKKLKKEKKQKRKSLPAKLPSQESVDLGSEKETTVSDSLSLGNTTKKSKSATKKLKRKSTGSIHVAEDSAVNGRPSPEPEKKNSANKKGAVVENGMEEGEIEILIPNKKYKGKYKEAFQKAKEDINESAQSEQSAGSNSNSTEPFASFEKVLKTPPAFVRKAVSKVTSNGKKSSKKSPTKTPPSGNGNGNGRRVSFGLHKNMEQEFHESLNRSPVVPYDPKITPNQGILKSTPLSQTKSPSLGASPKLNLYKKLAKKRKPRAEDFF